VRIAAERRPIFAPIGRLVNAHAGFGVAGRGVFASAGVERTVRGVISEGADRTRPEKGVRDINPVSAAQRLVCPPDAAASRPNPKRATVKCASWRDGERRDSA